MLFDLMDWTMDGIVTGFCSKDEGDGMDYGIMYTLSSCMARN